jgi:hypothetical protein
MVDDAEYPDHLTIVNTGGDASDSELSDISTSALQERITQLFRNQEQQGGRRRRKTKTKSTKKKTTSTKKKSKKASKKSKSKKVSKKKMTGGKRGSNPGFAAYLELLKHVKKGVGLPDNASVPDQYPVHALIKQIRAKVTRKHGELASVELFKQVKSEFEANRNEYMSEFKNLQKEFLKNPPARGKRKSRKSSKK